MPLETGEAFGVRLSFLALLVRCRSFDPRAAVKKSMVALCPLARTFNPAPALSMDEVVGSTPIRMNLTCVVPSAIKDPALHLLIGGK